MASSKFHKENWPATVGFVLESWEGSPTTVANTNSFCWTVLQSMWKVQHTPSQILQHMLCNTEFWLSTLVLCGGAYQFCCWTMPCRCTHPLYVERFFTPAFIAVSLVDLQCPVCNYVVDQPVEVCVCRSIVCAECCLSYGRGKTDSVHHAINNTKYWLTQSSAPYLLQLNWWQIL